MSVVGLKPDPSHVMLPPLKDLQALCSFWVLHQTSAYISFILNYVSDNIAKNTVSRSLKFFLDRWCAGQLGNCECFDLDYSALALFDPVLSSVVSMDTSNRGDRAVLIRIQENNTKKIVAFVSRTFIEAKRNCSVIRKDMPSCVWAAGQTTTLHQEVWIKIVGIS